MYKDFLFTIPVEDMNQLSPSTILTNILGDNYVLYYQKLNLDVMTVTFLGRFIKEKTDR